MKIAIIGAGAMGSVYAGLFAEAGHEVWVSDPWAAHCAAIRANGLRLEGASGDRTVTGLRVADAPGDLAGAGLFVIATKADGVAAAAEAVAPHLGPDALALTIQNGLGAAERIAAHLPPERVLLGVAEGFGASLRGPGHAHHTAMKRIRLGEIGGGVTPRLERLVALWREAGFAAEAYDDIDRLIWEKFLCNVTFSAPCGAFGCTVGELMADPERWAVALGCLREAWEEGRAQGVRFSFDDPEAYATAFGAQMPAARPSLLLDLMAGRPSEIGAINGMVPVLAARRGAAAPFNQTLAAVIRAREAADESPAGIARARPDGRSG
jgi:2-dehydropantoate 2-reductase